MKYTLDTNIFIDGFRSEETQAEVFAFLNRALPFTYLSAVVMQELAAGARSADAARDLQRGVFDPFERRRRVFAPSSAAFAESGRVLAAVAAGEGWQDSTKSRRSSMTHSSPPRAASKESRSSRKTATSSASRHS